MAFRQYRQILPLFISVALLYLGHGLQGTLTGIFAAEADFGATVTGIVMAGFPIGLLLSTLVTPSVVSKVGHVRVFAAYASVVSTCILIMPIWINPIAWFVLRVFIGICMAGLSIVVESWLNAASDNKSRGTVLSIYMVIVYIALGLGQFLLNVADQSGFVRFIIVSAAISLALVPISLTRTEQPSIENVKSVSLKRIFEASPLAFVGLITAGLGQSAIFSMGSLFGVMQGLSIGMISTMMAMPMIAVIFSQFPVGWLSDRYDRRKILVAVGLISSLIAVAMMMVGNTSALIIISLFGLFGAIAFPLYSLCLAHANDQMGDDEMLGASSKLVLVYGTGAIAGPLLVGATMQSMGAMGFVVFMLVIHSLFTVYGVVRVIMSKKPTYDGNDYLVQAGPMITPVAAAVYAEEYQERVGDDGSEDHGNATEHDHAEANEK